MDVVVRADDKIGARVGHNAVVLYQPVARGGGEVLGSWGRWPKVGGSICVGGDAYCVREMDRGLDRGVMRWFGGNRGLVMVCRVIMRELSVILKG